MSELIFYDDSVVNKIYFLLVNSGFPVFEQEGSGNQQIGILLMRNQDMVVVWEKQITDKIDSFFLSLVGECFAFNKSRLKVVFQDSIIRL